MGIGTVYSYKQQYQCCGSGMIYFFGSGFDFSDSSGQGCGSGSGLDPDSIGSVDPDPDPAGSGSRWAKMTHKSRQKLVKVHFLKCWMASF
jgi:hypothetical protein